MCEIKTMAVCLCVPACALARLRGRAAWRAEAVDRGERRRGRPTKADERATVEAPVALTFPLSHSLPLLAVVLESLSHLVFPNFTSLLQAHTHAHTHTHTRTHTRSQ